MILHGKNIKIYSSGMEIAMATSCTIETSADTNEISSSTSARSKNYGAGRTGWTVSIQKLISSMSGDLVMAGQEYILTIYVKDSDMLTGKAICTEVQTEFNVGKLAQGNCTFIGNGGLS